MNQNNNGKAGKITRQISEQGLPIIDRLLDKLACKNTSITYSFEEFEIDVPDVKGPKGQQIGVVNLPLMVILQYVPNCMIMLIKGMMVVEQRTRIVLITAIETAI